MLFDKIDIRPILRGHFATLRDNAFASRVSREDIVLFIALPFCVAISLTFAGFRFRLDAVNGFLNLFSILTGLLLNVLVLVLSLIGKNTENVDSKRRIQIIREVFANICYSVLVAIAVVCVALVALSYMRSLQGATTGLGATFLLVFLTLNFVLSLLMVLKRMYVLLDKDLKNDVHSKVA